ncbi:PREDICTED: uncharacterized protein LOC104586912 isoform X1 [Nelumbo nucifera]|uniref:Uncharacterized protein LOC104586912 isoform X1 n=1 Tax=Nelumbo nucifera TaxID=4432 RepID=A0A1U7Z5A7_NELNU|nr:PREDICTED: uncharacterized protein LOC104586912 isoform X1 [Nelumbo nucifera]
MAFQEGVHGKEIGSQRENSGVTGERCSGSCSSTMSSSAAAAEGEEEATFWGNESKCEVDRMVKIELDAARALADFVQLAQLESENPSGGSSGKWGNKRRRSRKRIKSESPARELGKDLENADTQISKEDAMIDQRQHKNLCNNVMIKTVKVEPDSELHRSSAIHPTGCASVVRGRSRQNLTEAEKEARRLRRILANRESARQTIRRRQAMCQELTRKAADLAWANENMKREKELVMKEYKLLKDRNEHLKAQMAKTVKAEVEGTPEKTASTNVEISAPSSSKLPLLLYNGPPFPPFIWPAIIQPLNPIQMQSAHATFLPDQVHLNSDLSSSSEQGTSQFLNGPRTPFYILPCPWFFPLPEHRNHLQPHPIKLFGSKDEQDNASIHAQHDRESLKELENVDNHDLSLNTSAKIDASSSMEAIPANNNPSKTSTGFPTDAGQTSGSHPQGMPLMPSPVSCVQHASTVKCENEFQPDSTSAEETASFTASHVGISLPERMFAPSMHLSKKLVDAAEARKRRKELTKLKNLHNKQLRLHC